MMAITLRLNDEQNQKLADLGELTKQKTASGTIKYMLDHYLPLYQAWANLNHEVFQLRDQIKLMQQQRDRLEIACREITQKIKQEEMRL